MHIIYTYIHLYDGLTLFWGNNQLEKLSNINHSFISPITAARSTDPTEPVEGPPSFRGHPMHHHRRLVTGPGEEASARESLMRKRGR